MTIVKRIARLALLIAGLILPTLVVAGEGKSTESERRDILFIMTDQQRWDFVGANGNKTIRTPNVDRLAAEGANFTHMFVQSPVCVPLRVCIRCARLRDARTSRLWRAIACDLRNPAVIVPQSQTAAELPRRSL